MDILNLGEMIYTYIGVVKRIESKGFTIYVLGVFFITAFHLTLCSILVYSPISTSTQLDDKSQHGLFGRHITSDDGTAIPAILFFRDVLKIDHLAIIQ